MRIYSLVFDDKSVDVDKLTKKLDEIGDNKHYLFGCFLATDLEVSKIVEKLELKSNDYVQIIEIKSISGRYLNTPDQSVINWLQERI